MKPVELSQEINDLLKSRGYYQNGEETWADLSKRVSSVIADGDKELEQKFYELIATQKFIPSSPTLMNANIEKCGGLSSCFIIDIGDSIEDIFKAQERCAKIFQYNGGVGFDISPIRPSMSPLTTAKGNAGGVVAFMHAFNQVADSMTRNNSRKSATKIDLQVWHPDIYEFIHCKDDGVCLPLMNISVSIPDDFMTLVKQDGMWDLEFPDYAIDKNYYNKHWNGDLKAWKAAGKSTIVYKTVRARELFHEIAESAWRRGDPGVIFTDHLDLKNSNKHIAKCTSSNPCSEFNSIPYSACCLGSFNFLKYVQEAGTLDGALMLMKKDIPIAVTFLDNVIDLNQYPIEEIKKVTQNNRSIGIGLMGLADAFYLLEIPYNSSLAKEYTARIFSTLNNMAVEASKRLADQRGVYPNHNGSTWWKDGISIRNSDHTSVAPTGSISFFAGVSSGIEPNFGLSYTRTTNEGNKYYITNQIFEQKLKELGLFSEELLDEIAGNKGSCQGIKEIPEELQQIFVVSHDLTPEEHINITAEVQKHISLSVSKTVNFSYEATVEDVENTYFYAYDKGLLGITVYRDGCRESQVLSTGERKQSFDIPDEEEVETPNWGDVVPTHDRVIGQKRKIRTACGNLHIAAFFDPQTKRMVEVFTSRGGQGGCTALQSTVSRLISRSLRLGDTPDRLNKQLQSTLSCPNWNATNIKRVQKDEPPLSKGFSCASAIGMALIDMQNEIQGITPNKKKNVSNEGRLCPECGTSLMTDGGCLTCKACGWSKCS